ncbi:hypothetical protein RI129_012292 [Pyrocoelia pectoralis]|uniref:Uncharacterized protein n=1 Tax=Pyrocoelia pectoralis TaxID=417401 RepID=A0AAN7ZBX8_9COLE
MNRAKKYVRKRKYDISVPLSLGTTRRVKVPFESLSIEPRRSKRIKRKNNSDVYQVFNSETDYYAHAQQRSIFREIDENYEKALLKMNQSSAEPFYEILREVPKYPNMKQKSIRIIKSLITQIDSTLDGNNTVKHGFVPEQQWVYNTPSNHNENLRKFTFKPFTTDDQNTVNFFNTTGNYTFNFEDSVPDSLYLT